MANLPGSVPLRGMRNVPHLVRANLGSSEYGGHVEGVVDKGREEWLGPGHPLGPGARDREGGSGSCPPGRRLHRLPWPAPDRPSWPEASGLGCRPTLPGGVENAAWARPRALEVGQVLLCSRSWRPCPGVGRPVGSSSPTRARVCTHTDVNPLPYGGGPQARTPGRALSSRPAAQMGARRPQNGQELLSHSGQRWHEAATRTRKRGISAPSHGPGSLDKSLTPRRTSQQGCYATNRMWPASRSIAPGLEGWEGVAKGTALGTQAGPGSSGPPFPHLYNGHGCGPVTVAVPEPQPILATPTPHTDNSVLGRPNTTLRPLPLPTVLTGTRCSNLVVLGWGWQDPAGWQARPGFGPGTYNQLLPL